MDNCVQKFYWPVSQLPQIVLCGRFYHQADDFKVRYTCDINALHIYGYDGIIKIGSFQSPFCAGDMTLTPVGQSSTYKFPQSGLHHCIHFRASEKTEQMCALDLHIPARRITPPAGEQIKKAIHIFNFPAPAAQKQINGAIASAMLLEALLTLQNNTFNSDRKEDDPISRLLSVIDSTLADNPTMPQLAAAVDLSQNYLAVMFKKTVGKTIKQFILERKIARARYLLESTDIQIKAVAREVGIEDEHYFNKKFRFIEGISPLKYRLRQR